jgi:DNA (cytosine-5)-methyltransferase 3A
LENVIMKKEYRDKISELLWVQPIEINSALVSAQNRRRYYWTNIPWVIQPKDKWILLKDILQDHVDEKYYYSAERWNKLISNPHNHDFLKRVEDSEWKCRTLTSVTGWNQEKKVQELVSLRGGGNY